jgi:hypothetical protein
MKIFGCCVWCDNCRRAYELVVALALLWVLTAAGCGTVNPSVDAADHSDSKGGAGGTAAATDAHTDAPAPARDASGELGQADAGLPICPFVQNWQQCGSAWPACFTCAARNAGAQIPGPCVFRWGDPDAGTSQPQPDGAVVIAYCVPDCSAQCPP